MFGYSNLFSVQEIIVSGGGKFVKNEDIKEILKSNIGINIFKISAGSIKSNIKNNFLSLEKVSVKRIFPSKIKVQVYEKTGAAVIIREGEYEGLLIDKDGFVLGFATSDLNYTKIYYTNINEFSVGSFTNNKDILDILSLIEVFKTNSIKIENIMIYGDSYKLNISGILVFLNKVDGKDKSELLNKIIKKYQIEAKVLEKVDLRFKDPVVEYAEKSE